MNLKIRLHRFSGYHKHEDFAVRDGTKTDFHNGEACVAIVTFLNSPTVWGFVRLELWPCYLRKFVSKRYTFKDKALLNPKEDETDLYDSYPYLISTLLGFLFYYCGNFDKMM